MIPLLAIVLHFCVGETLSSGFTLGFATGIAAVALFFVVQSARALRNSEKLRKMYIAETDERNSIFKVAAQFLGILIILAAVALATLVSSYFNRTVFYTFVSLDLLYRPDRGGCKFYYHKKLS